MTRKAPEIIACAPKEHLAPLRIGAVAIDTPVILAPMAGITDLPMREMVLGFGAGLVVSEMVASQDMINQSASARLRASLGIGARSAVQIAGRDPHLMAEAARLCADLGAAIIDINMGCPAKQVTSGASGAALMRAPGLALGIIEAVVGAVDVPVTLKMRLGWDESCLNAQEIARAAEGAGVQMITIHGRTRAQFYKGSADWAAIAPIAAAVRVPVVANGDITSTAAAKEALAASSARGVMIGRAVQGRPWLLAQIAAGLGLGAPPLVPQGAARLTLILTHYEAMLSFYGRELGGRVARKHLGWYLDALPFAVPPSLRREILTAATPEAAITALGALDWQEAA